MPIIINCNSNFNKNNFVVYLNNLSDFKPNEKNENYLIKKCQIRRPQAFLNDFKSRLNRDKKN